jgi:hypothetical protein
MDNFDTAGSLDVETEYLTGSQIRDYLRGVMESGSDAVIMKYMIPDNGFHNMVRVIFTPYLVKVEKHESVFLVRDHGVPLKMRMCTSYVEGKACFNNCHVSAAIEQKAVDVRLALFQYFQTYGSCVENAVTYFTEISG